MVKLLRLIRKEKPKPEKPEAKRPEPKPEPNFTPEPLDPANHPD
jgi:hypothetical protein